FSSLAVIRLLHSFPTRRSSDLEAGRAIVNARAERPFTSIDDLHYRVPELRKDELRKLAAVGALNLLGARASRPLVFINHNHVGRSEEHTSELQSRGHLVCRLLL